MSIYLKVYDLKNNCLGTFDGEIFDTSPKINLRVDGEEVYIILGNDHFGYYENGNIIDLSGNVKYAVGKNIK